MKEKKHFEMTEVPEPQREGRIKHCCSFCQRQCNSKSLTNEMQACGLCQTRPSGEVHLLTRNGLPKTGPSLRQTRGEAVQGRTAAVRALGNDFMKTGCFR